MFQKILIANRGEIARRIARTAHRMGIGVVAVHSEADAQAPFVKEADEAVLIGPPAPKDSYLRAEVILDAALRTGAQAIHPGYGFLSENTKLVEACTKAGVAFIGPSTQAMLAMASKIDAKRTMQNAGVPVVPGSEDAIQNEDEAVALAEKIGYPVMLKASSGGGGIGMYRCDKEKQLRQNFADAQKKGEQFFGSAAVFIEKYVEKPHHVEVQILADRFGKTLHLFERECSIQRRHQKIVEETPSPFISEETRRAICQTAVTAAKAVGYTNAGTVEFIVGADQQFYFLEMNTRLQVEHPITEAVLGLDIVEQQLRIAYGEPLAFAQEDLKQTGHAIELRLCAEDPDKRFFPSPGTIQTAVWPTQVGVRIDAGIESGSDVPPYYDSLLAKIIGHGKTRAETIALLRTALDDLQVTGVTTNANLHKRILDDEAFQIGEYNTGYLLERFQLKS